MDEKQKMLLLKIANNSIAAASAVASVADNDYGNVSASLLRFSTTLTFPRKTFGLSCHMHTRVHTNQIFFSHHGDS